MRSFGSTRDKRTRLGVTAVALAMMASTVLTGTALAQDQKTINVAIVGNPQMEDIAKLTPDLFTAETGINVNYVVLEEQTLREIVTRDVGAGGQQFDVVMIGMFEAPRSAGTAGSWTSTSTQRAMPSTTSTTSSRPCATACPTKVACTPRRSTRSRPS